MFDCHSDKIAIFVKIDEDVSIYFSGFKDLVIAELYMSCICIRKEFDFHDCLDDPSIRSSPYELEIASGLHKLG